jgi:hypothetical protein
MIHRSLRASDFYRVTFSARRSPKTTSREHKGTASLAPNPHSAMRIPTALDLSPGGSTSVRHVLGGVQTSNWRSMRDAVIRGDRLCMAADDGSRVDVPFDGSFLS